MKRFPLPLLTFDDGPSSWTPAILDLLAEHDIAATFFVIGQHVKTHPDTVKRIDREGHVIGNHSHSHPRLTEIDNQQLRREFIDTNFEIEAAVGYAPTVWRAPFFGLDARVTVAAAEAGLVAHIGASVIPDDWMSDDPEKIAGTVLRLRKPRSMICLHDGIPPDGGSTNCTASRQPTVDAVRIILEALA